MASLTSYYKHNLFFNSRENGRLTCRAINDDSSFSGPSHIANMDIAHVASTLSELNLMTYDFHGAFSETTGTNAPLYYQGWGEVGFSVHDCVENWLAGE